MRKLFCTLVAVVLLAGCSSVKNFPVITKEYGSLDGYSYVYVLPTSGVASGSAQAMTTQYYASSSVEMNSVSPAEQIKGFFIKNGFVILPEIAPDLADKTMIVSYGCSNGVVLQMTNAKTHNLLATYEAQGAGKNQTVAISNALQKILNVYSYRFNPRIWIQSDDRTDDVVYVQMTNETPKTISSVTLKISYYDDSKLIHEQYATFKNTLLPGDFTTESIKRQTLVRSRAYRAKVEVVEYK